MSIHNDGRQFGSDEDYRAWKQDLNWEYRRQEYFDRRAERQKQDLETQFDTICQQLKESGADLSKIPIVMEKGHSPTYITKRIMEDLKNGT